MRSSSLVIVELGLELLGSPAGTPDRSFSDVRAWKHVKRKPDTDKAPKTEIAQELLPAREDVRFVILPSYPSIRLRESVLLRTEIEAK